MGTHRPHLHIAIPALDELEWLPRTLQSIADSQFPFGNADAERECPFTVYVCVNQPDKWWNDDEKRGICESNQKLLHLLRRETRFPLEILDFCSPGKGWQGKNFGVGWARKVLFNRILAEADAEDLLVSLDADTQFGPHYLSAVLDSMRAKPQWLALSAPYYHELTGDELFDRAILRYELFMRNYALNMLAIGSPYAFTAIGSAIAARCGALRKIGGITPMKSGEDFYLVQKLRKMGMVGTYCSECVRPAARFSARVDFGTGPAMMKGANGDWSSYPIYHRSLFQKVEETYQLIAQIYHHDVDTDFTRFLQAQFKTADLWQSIRANVRNADQFARAFHEKADGLRILQFLKMEQKRANIPDEVALADNLNLFFNTEERNLIQSLFSSNRPLESLSSASLNAIRDSLFRAEMRKRETLS